jgi:hypothetical protein
MKHSDFMLGKEFQCDGKPYRVTDIGKRVIIAIPLNHPEDTSWYEGPPYCVQERVIDEYDFAVCEFTDDVFPDKKLKPLTEPGRR